LNSIADIEQERQPFLPRVRMIWFFVIAALVAVALGVTRMAEQGQALAAGLVFAVLFLATFFGLAALAFAVAYFFGATERAMADAQATPANPFSDGTPPPQLIPPRANDEHV